MKFPVVAIKTVISVLLLFISTMCTFANENKLIVIYDSGNTYPIDKYLPKRAVQLPENKSSEENLPSRLPFKLPIITPSMNVGKVTITPKHLSQLQRPLFLIGSDETSKTWLKKNRFRLIEVGADGLLIQVESMEDIATMLELAIGLTLVPASAEGFASKLGLTHYPVLLSKEGWEQ